MKYLTHLMMTFLFITLTLVFTATTAQAQDAVKADPQHYTIEFENDQMRVVRIKYGPREKSVMHSHSAGVVILLTDTNVRQTLADGKTEERQAKAGQVLEHAAVTHSTENLSDQPFEAILVEVKAKPAKTKQAKRE